MAEVSWKATFIGAFILFLIGVVVATCLNYAQPALRSINAGIAGPFDCFYDAHDNASKAYRKVLCNETTFFMQQNCVYIFVSYSNSETRHSGLKLTPSYRYNLITPKQSGQKLIQDDGLGRVSD